MLAALYSRSPTSVVEHLEQVRIKGADTFMSRWYCQYGHKSIGDCGTVTIFAENISMLCAKAIQDNPLYNGQEASTRYLDFSERPIINPIGTEEGAQIQRTWVNLYNEVLTRLLPQFEERFPHQEGEKKSVWKKAIKARAFDVARGFLPAGCTTFAAWHTNLRQAHDHLHQMKHNPCAEIRQVAERIHIGLKDRYPSSFGHKEYPATEYYLACSAGRFAFTDAPATEFDAISRLDLRQLRNYRDLLEARPPKTELHQRFRQFGYIDFRFMIDYGSFRDLQRHRSCVQDMPLLTTKHHIHNWYLEQLDDATVEQVCKVAALQEKRINNLELSDEEKQYYVAMGYQVAHKITCSLPSAVYIAELRSSPTVHPTARVIAQAMGDVLADVVPGLAMHHDKSMGVWDIKRGEEDIIERAS